MLPKCTYAYIGNIEMKNIEGMMRLQMHFQKITEMPKKNIFNEKETRITVYFDITGVLQ